MTRPARRSMRLVLALALLICCIGCDQVTKHIATETLRGRPPQSYCSNMIRLQYALNPGGFLSLGANLAPQIRFWAFTAMNAVFLAVLGYLLATRWSVHWATFSAMVLLLGGGIGNQVDRMLHGGLVTDFICLGIGPVRTGIFNVADVALTAGAVILVFVYRSPTTDQGE